MKDQFSIKPDKLSLQAQLHHQIRDKLKEVVSDFDTHHSTIVTQLDSSLQEHYREWWQNVRNHMLDQSEVHDQLGTNLLTTGDNFTTVDDNIAKNMQENTNPSTT